MAAGEKEPAKWRRAAFFGGATVPLTTSELETLGDALRALISPYLERLTDRTATPPGARPVRVLLGGTPLPERDESMKRPS